MLRVFLFFGLCFGVCAYALWRGRMPERTMGAIFLAGVGLTVISHSPALRRYVHVEPGTALVDGGMLLAMLALTLRHPARSFIAIVAMQLVTVLMHLAKLIDPASFRATYKIALDFWSYPQLLLLAYETFRTERIERESAAR